MRLKSQIPTVAIVLLLNDQAYAHTGGGAVFSFSTGIMHPLGGFDHLLAMFAVGLFAAQLGGRALWQAPAAFVAMMVVGAVIGLAGVELPGAELGIVVSVVAIALPVAFALGMPAPLAMAYVGFFALFHGYAHGAELPVDADVVPYVAGFTLATAAVHALGVGAGLRLGFIGAFGRMGVLRLAGAAIALAGMAFGLA
jgi:urease accessory protein